MKNKKIIFLGIVAVLIIGAVFYLKDNSAPIDTQKVESSINESTNDAIDELNDDSFGDDINFDDIEEAPLAIDTTKPEK
jgi:hypothetical protein